MTDVTLTQCCLTLKIILYSKSYSVLGIYFICNCK